MKLYVVGIGPGNMENMTLKAHRALENCQVIVGYPVYVDPGGGPVPHGH